jgi:uncharacterized membrane protein
VPDSPTNEPRAIHSREWRWLRTETDAWIHDGLIDEALRDRILGRYHVDTAATERRGLAILSALAGLAAAIAVLLLIGYNWDVIPRAVKVAMIFGAVAAAFAGSAVAYSRGRSSGGEQLAFLGTLFYGNAIWLLAQVFHISGRYPDGALWWAIGALVAGHVLTSRLNAFQAAVLINVWIIMDASLAIRPSYQFLALGAMAVWLAYRTRSAWALGLTLLSVPLWIAIGAGITLEAGPITLGLVLLTGCAFFAASKLHPPHTRFAVVWEVLGLVTIAMCLVPLMIHDVQQSGSDGPLSRTWPLLMVAPASLLFMAWVSARMGWGSIGQAVVAVSALTAGWIGWRLATDVQGNAVLWVIVIAFSAATLFIGVTLMRTAMRTDRAGLFAGGVAFVLLFLLVRWIDLLGSMVWSALFLLAVAGLLLWMARLWRSREVRS